MTSQKIRIERFVGILVLGIGAMFLALMVKAESYHRVDIMGHSIGLGPLLIVFYIIFLVFGAVSLSVPEVEEY